MLRMIHTAAAASLALAALVGLGPAAHAASTCNGLPVTIDMTAPGYAGGGQGTDGDDVILGDGDTNIHALGGNDTICPGDASAAVYGDEGNDTILGGPLRDDAYGWYPMSGGPGNDLLLGGPEANYILGGDGDDVIAGSGGSDYIYGEAGNDRIDGGDDFDSIKPGTGNDSITGGAGADSLDYRDAPAGMTFSLDADRVGAWQHTGGSGIDRLTDRFYNISTSWYADTVYGSSGNDLIDAQKGNDVVYGKGGADDLDGGLDKDKLYAGAGKDFCDGGYDSSYDVGYSCESRKRLSASR